MARASIHLTGNVYESGGQTLVTEPRPSFSSGSSETPGESDAPLGDAVRDMRSEVNAYASAILVRLLGIVTQMPDRRRIDVEGIEREIRQMLAFIDPQLALGLDDQPPLNHGQADSDEPSVNPSALPPPSVDARVDDLIATLQKVDLQGESTVESLRDIRQTLSTLRDDLRSQNETTTEALQSLMSTTRSLHYTITALAARTEHITDVTGIAEERIRVGVWQYALIAGLSSGAVVAAVVAFISLIN